MFGIFEAAHALYGVSLQKKLAESEDGSTRLRKMYEMQLDEEVKSIRSKADYHNRLSAQAPKQLASACKCCGSMQFRNFHDTLVCSYCRTPMEAV